MIPKIIVHGGAWDIPENLHLAHIDGINDALKIGIDFLKKTDDSVQTVIEIIKSLENNPVFDAGIGSFLNSRGEVEMDAGIMLGDDLSAGAVAGIQNVKNPIVLADLIRTKTQHCLLMGAGAWEFAQKQGLKITDTEDLLVGREKELYKKLKAKEKVEIKSFFKIDMPGDTVGAVVLNSKGSICAATSTGGTPFKMAGRVGDSPIPGAGYYADNEFAGISATGWGEGIMRVLLSRLVIENVSSGLDVHKSAENAIKTMHKKVNGWGGIIAIDKNGKTAFSHNTPFMAVGEADPDGINYVKIGSQK